MAVAATLPIIIEDDGVAIIEGTNIRVSDIARAKQRTGLTPEELQAKIPLLTLAQIYAALAYYYAHQEEMDAEMERQRAEVERALRKLKPKNPPPPGSNGMDQIIGQWPGDETEEEVMEALERLS